MPRKKRKKIELTKESVNDLFQEVYDDSYTLRAQIIRMFNKWEKRVKDGGDIAAMGDQIVKLINAQAKNQDQKIMILKFLKEVVFVDQEKVESNNTSVGDIDRDGLIEMAKKAMESGDINMEKIIGKK